MSATKERIAYVNGKMVPESQAVISIHDKGFVYGDAIFDTLRTFGGKAFRMKEHVDRLFETLTYVRIDCGMTPDEVNAVLDEVIEANAGVLPEGEDWWVTIRVSAGVLSYGGEAPLHEGPTVVVECVPLPLRARARFFSEGVPMAITHRPRIDPKALSPNAKTNNYMNMMLAQREVDAIAPGNWALMPDRNGNLAEGPGCNLFIVKNGTVITPTEEFILAGVSRAEVISICREKGIPVIERDVSVHAAMTADEAFLTSTSLCVCPVRSLDGHAYPGGMPGALTKQLMDAFSARADYDYVAQYLRFIGNAEASTGL